MKLVRRLVKALSMLVLLGVLALLYIGLQGSVVLSNPGSVNKQLAAIAPLLAQVQTAHAILADPSGASALSGQVTLSETGDGLIIQADVSNAPSGYHGFHVHEAGSCADGGNAAGGHFNPDGVKHGKLALDGFENAHAGDLGNIFITADGSGSLTQTVPGLTLSQGTYAIANRAIILHADRDDFGQPTGNAGGRLACGIIEISSPS